MVDLGPIRPLRAHLFKQQDAAIDRYAQIWPNPGPQVLSCVVRIDVSVQSNLAHDMDIVPVWRGVDPRMGVRALEVKAIEVGLHVDLPVAGDRMGIAQAGRTLGPVGEPLVQRAELFDQRPRTSIEVDEDEIAPGLHPDRK